MKKGAFMIVYLGYFILGVAGFLKFKWYGYVEQDSWHKVINGHFLLLICSGAISGMLLFLLYRKWLSDEYTKRRDKLWFKIVAPVLYLLSGVVLNTGMLFHEDLFFSDTGKLQINGIVMNKNIQTGSRGGKKYFVSISDTITTQNYYFMVKKRIYEKARRGDVITKEFHISKLGIIYRKEE